MGKILLVDGNSILNRAFYGLPELTTKDGIHTNAVLGFLNIVLKVLDEEKADHMCVAFDVKHPTFRHTMFKEYKGTRKPMPQELSEQLPIIKEVLGAMNIKILEKPGYEADDILGTMSRIAYNAGLEVTVLSGDRDLLQLATDKILIRIPKTKGGKTIIESYYDKDVKDAYGVDPITFIDMKGLMGDTSDNIPGVPGIGEKTAGKLLAEYGSMDGVYENLDSMKQSKMKDNLIEYKEQAYLSKKLATIKLDCELDDNIESAVLSDMYNDAALDIFKRLEFKSLFGRFSEKENKLHKKFSWTVIEDYDVYAELISSMKNADKLGFSLILGDNVPVGASIALNENMAYLVKFVNFVNFDMLKRDIMAISQSTEICLLDVKSHLAYIPFNEESLVFDCGVGAYLLNPMKSGYEYDAIGSDYMDTDLEDRKSLIGKTGISIFSFEDEKMCTYMTYLSVVPFASAGNIKDSLKQKEMYKLYKEIELPCVYSLYEMEKNGIRVDKAGLSAFGGRLKDEISRLTKQIYELAGEEFNINSTRQLGEILFEKLGLKSGKKTKTGYSTGVDVLEKISSQHEIVPAILMYRQLTKLNSTYVDGLLPCIMKDGRIHGKFNQTVTATGRISSTEPNLQNIPTRLPLGREIRKVFIPEDGYVFLDADYSQIELRVLAHLSNDETLIEAYNKNSDIHAITASQVFDVPLSQVTDIMRRKAKAVNFGIVYGISSFGLGQDLDISRKEAETYIEKYFSTYGNVKKYLDESVEKARKTGYSVTIFNRRRPIPELKSSNYIQRSFGERVAMNSPIQGTAADIIKIAMINVNRELKKRKLLSRIVLQVHDELLIETKTDELDEVKEILVDNMMNAASLRVPLVVDVSSGNSWYEAK